MTYIIQTFTLAESWTNSWSDITDDGAETPVTFATRAEAEAELGHFLSDKSRDASSVRIKDLAEDAP